MAARLGTQHKSKMAARHSRMVARESRMAAKESSKAAKQSRMVGHRTGGSSGTSNKSTQ